jgi:NitT/TauT family transport system substrate-binding protein
MRLAQDRRDFLKRLTAAGAAGVLGSGRALANEGPPEVTTIRIPKLQGICLAPLYVSEELLRAEWLHGDPLRGDLRRRSQHPEARGGRY